MLAGSMRVPAERSDWAVLSIFFIVLFWFGTASADIFVYKDAQGVLHFTNVPAHAGFRLAIREWRGSSAGSSLEAEDYDQLIRQAADRYRVDPDLVRAVIKVESDFDSLARSTRGAQGLMQLMPQTAKLHNVGDAYDPASNIDGGVRHLRLLFDHFRGDLTRTLAAYNAGVKTVERYGGIPPYDETKEYVRRVLDRYESLRKKEPVSVRELVTR